MICQLCHGNGFVTPPGRRHPDEHYPCPTCGGSGVDHCCDGDQPNPYDEVNGRPFSYGNPSGYVDCAPFPEETRDD